MNITEKLEKIIKIKTELQEKVEALCKEADKKVELLDCEEGLEG